MLAIHPQRRSIFIVGGDVICSMNDFNGTFRKHWVYCIGLVIRAVKAVANNGKKGHAYKKMQITSKEEILQ